jgi:hypothetical protein
LLGKSFAIDLSATSVLAWSRAHQARELRGGA